MINNNGNDDLVLRIPNVPPTPTHCITYRNDKGDEITLDLGEDDQVLLNGKEIESLEEIKSALVVIMRSIQSWGNRNI